MASCFLGLSSMNHNMQRCQPIADIIICSRAHFALLNTQLYPWNLIFWAENSHTGSGCGIFCLLVHPKVIACGTDLSFSPDVLFFLVCPKTIVFRRTYVLLQMFIFFIPREISEMRGPTGVKFCMMVRTRYYFIMPVQNFGGPSPKKFQGPKTCKIWQIWPDFRRLWSSAANISETDEDIQNRIFTLSTVIPPALGETSPMNFGPVTLEISMWTHTHLKRIFRKNIFRPLGGAAPQNFYTR